MLIRESIEKMIASGDTGEAIKTLTTHLNGQNQRLYSQTILLSGRFNKWEKDKRLGLGPKDSILEEIRWAILQILDEIETDPLAPSISTYKIDWGPAPDIDLFCGRDAEMQKLEQWIIKDRCRMVGVFGIDSMGKTTLVTQFAKLQANQFEYVFWYPLKNAPPTAEFLTMYIQFLTSSRPVDLPGLVEEQIRWLIQFFREHRCLLIFDNAESVLHEAFSMHQENGYDLYIKLIEAVGQAKHQSCVLITSRINPSAFEHLETETNFVRSFYLQGLQYMDIQKMLSHKNLFGSERDWESLTNMYSGNPGVLKIVGGVVEKLYKNDIVAFLQHGVRFFTQIDQILSKQIEGLPIEEMNLLYQLALAGEPISEASLREAFLWAGDRQKKLMNALFKLIKYSLVEISEIYIDEEEKQGIQLGYSLQNIIREYLLTNLIDQITAEIIDGDVHLLNQCAIINPEAKDYIRQSQQSTIFRPVLERLLQQFDNISQITEHLQRIIDSSRNDPQLKNGFMAGNVLNFSTFINRSNLNAFDCSGLTVRNAFLRDAILHDVDFSHADLSKAFFRENFQMLMSLQFDTTRYYFASGDLSGNIYLWETNPLRKTRLFSGHESTVWSIAFSADGKRMLSCSHDRSVRLWDVENERLLTILYGHTSWVTAVNFLQQEKFAVSAGGDKTIRIWDLESGKCLNTVKGHTSTLHALVVSADQRTLISGDGSGTIKIWMVADTGNPKLLKTLNKHDSLVTSLRLTDDDRILISGSQNGTVIFWDIREPSNCSELFTMDEQLSGGGALAISPGNRFLASSGKGKEIKIWDISKIEHPEYISTLNSHTSKVHAITFKNEQKLISCGDDKTLKIWNVKIGQCIESLKGYSSWINAIQFDPFHPAIIATANDDGTLKLWDIEKRKLIFSQEGHLDRVTPLAFYTDRDWVVSGSNDMTICFWDVQAHKKHCAFKAHDGYIRSLAIDAAGSLLFSAGYDRKVNIWNVENVMRPVLLQSRSGFPHWLGAMALSPDNQCITYSTESGEVVLWYFKSGKINTLQTDHLREIQSLLFSPDGRFLITGGSDGAIEFWEMESRNRMARLLEHTGTVNSLSFSPDGKFFVSGSGDTTVRLWDTEALTCIHVFKEHTYFVHAVCFSPDGQKIVSGGADETLCIWDMSTRSLSYSLHNPMPYSGMIITGAKGLSDARKQTLISLGSIE